MADGEPDPATDPETLRARLTERLSRIRGDLETLRSAVDRSLSRADPARPGSGSAVWARSTRRLDGAADQVEALHRLLEECRLHASRAALLVERDGSLSPWRSAGFASPPERRADRRALSGPAVARVLEGFPVGLAGDEISTVLDSPDASDARGGAEDVRAVLVPFVVRERVSGAVYADSAGGSGGRLDPDAIAMLAYLAGLVVDRLSKRKLVPAPALRPLEERGLASESGASERPASERSVLERAASPVAGGNGRGLAGPLVPDGPEERRQAARQFARLLASEIKLYNEPAVLEGVERGNLYARLSDVIDRGRQLYEERLPEDLRAGPDYYYEELVDVLAGGRSEVLGI